MKILFFSPYAAIWVHSFPEALIAEHMQKLDHEVIYVTCGGVFKKSCAAMSIYGVDLFSTEKQKKDVCKACDAKKRLLRSNLKLNGVDLEQYLDDKDRDQINAIVKGTNKNNFYEMSVEGFNVGRISLYNLILKHKKVSLNFDQTQWAEYLVELENTLLTLYAGKKLLAKEMPDRVIIYNTYYPTNHMFCLLSEQAHAEPYFIHAGPNLSERLTTLLIGKRDYCTIFDSILDSWPKFRTIPCTSKSINMLKLHVEQLFKATNPFVYSSPSTRNAKDIFNIFNIKDGQKIILAIMSSHDEFYAQDAIGESPTQRGHKIIFETQNDWIKALIDYYGNSNDYHVIIRIHPRILPNKREVFTSEYYFELKDIFSNLPSNISINWPEDGLSLYSLANYADVALNCWSSSGKELALFGLPVVNFGHTWILYPCDLNYSVASYSEYFKVIDKAIEDGWCFNTCRYAARWYALEQDYSIVDLSDGFQYNENESFTFSQRLLNKLLRTTNPLLKQKRDLRHRLPLKSGGTVDALLQQSKKSVIELPMAVIPRTSKVDEEHLLNELLKMIADELLAGQQSSNTKKTLANKIQAHLKRYSENRDTFTDEDVSETLLTQQSTRLINLKD